MWRCFLAESSVSFLTSYRCPPREDWDSWAEKGKTMWYGLGAKSCKNHSDAIRTACQQFHEVAGRDGDVGGGDVEAEQPADESQSRPGGNKSANKQSGSSLSMRLLLCRA
jgi:hypothetical protein